jgi:dipeptidyl aminopeptidase/acylaminoacyl peptidase
MPAPTATLGHWHSPISAALLASQGLRLNEPQLCGERVFWLEARPLERGRTTLMCSHLGHTQELLPAPHSLRTRAHEYGGGAYLVVGDLVFMVLDADQRIYQLPLCPSTGAPQLAQLRALTPAGAYRYADFCFDVQRNRLLAVRENYTQDAHNPPNDIIALALDESAADAPASLHISVLASGADFYSNPRLSPCGKQLSYLQWNHPQMPWDGSELIIANLDTAGAVSQRACIAGGTTEAIVQPQWSPQGELFFISDRSDWWNLYCWDGQRSHALLKMAAEFAAPRWVFGLSYYGFVTAEEIFCAYSTQGEWQLGLIRLTKKAPTISARLEPIASEFCALSHIVCAPGRAVFIAASRHRGEQIFTYNAASATVTALQNQATMALDPAYISAPEALSFNTSDGELAHGFFYRPNNPEHTYLAPALPPLLVMCHGGPTGATDTSLNLKIQFWTSRGFAVLDVNYRGSSGYGRIYRDRLKRNWGITDVIDVCSGAEYLVAQGLVNPQQLAIRGSSAGGYTVLAALTFAHTFKLGASLYGIGDLAALAQDTHKFEARYLDSLVGDYPAEREVYRARSPIHHIDKLTCPVIFLQGLQDKVVPPAQAEAMVAALTHKGIYTEYVTFAEEGHGFRQGDNIARALEAELAFYVKNFSR